MKIIIIAIYFVFFISLYLIGLYLSTIPPTLKAIIEEINKKIIKETPKLGYKSDHLNRYTIVTDRKEKE